LFDAVVTFIFGLMAVGGGFSEAGLPVWATPTATTTETQQPR